MNERNIENDEGHGDVNVDENDIPPRGTATWKPRSNLHEEFVINHPNHIPNFDDPLFPATTTPNDNTTALEFRLPSGGRHLCLLVVADLDLRSAAALAESALSWDRESPHGTVDGIIACGPLTNRNVLIHEYLRPQEISIAGSPKYHSKKNSPKTMPLEKVISKMTTLSHRYVEDSIPYDDCDYWESLFEQENNDADHYRLSSPPYDTYHDDDDDDEISNSAMPLELQFALEGLVTGCLSQLESIVCRVLWLPCRMTDPPTSWQEQMTVLKHDNSDVDDVDGDNDHYNTNYSHGPSEPRWTPNSRNLHRRILPLAPGLYGCGLSLQSSSEFDLQSEKSCPKYKNGEKENVEEGSDNELWKSRNTMCQELSTTFPIITSHGPKIHVRPAGIIVTTRPPTSKSKMKLPLPKTTLLHVDTPLNAEMQWQEEDHILTPGSLRQRGEYSLVHLELVPEPNEECESIDESVKTFYSWQISKVDLRRMEE
jgi:hypothetical protein